jgi:aminoglycoside phosphotransferase (APT) family kinase protein
MFFYTADQIRTALINILGTDRFVMTPIGNHELGRHLVYKLVVNNREPLVFKLYCKKNRRVREIASLNLLRDTFVKCAVIEGTGELPDGTEWMLSSFISGSVLDHLWPQMSRRQSLRLFEELGEELGKIHSAASFDFFGHWDEHGKSLYQLQYYHTEFVRSSEYVFRQIYKQDLPDQVLLERAVSMIRKNYHLIQPVKESRLTHHDYDGRNILIEHSDAGWFINGVLDFEQSYPGNREIDLAGIYARYLMGSSQRERAFYKGYEKYLDIDPGFMNRLPYYLLCKGVVICSWTHQQAPDYYDEGIRLIERFYSLVES